MGKNYSIPMFLCICVVVMSALFLFADNYVLNPAVDKSYEYKIQHLEKELTETNDEAMKLQLQEELLQTQKDSILMQEFYEKTDICIIIAVLIVAPIFLVLFLINREEEKAEIRVE